MALGLIVAIGFLLAGCATTNAIGRKAHDDNDDAGDAFEKGTSAQNGSIRMPIGDYYLIDNGNGLYRPEFESGDALVDANNNLVSEKENGVQKILAGLGMQTFEGVAIRKLNDYMTVFSREKGVLGTAKAADEVIESYRKIVEVARDAGVATGVESPFTEQMMEYLGARGHIIPLYFAREDAGFGCVDAMEAELAIAEEHAKKHGRDISARTDDIRREGYSMAIDQGVMKAKDAVEGMGYRFTDKMKVSLEAVVEHVNAKDHAGTPLFPQGRISEVMKLAESTRLLGFRKAVKAKISSAESHISGGGFEWIRKMNDELSLAEARAREGDVYAEFSQTIVETRRKGYDEAIESEKREAVNAVDGQGYDWLRKTNDYLDNAIALARANVRVSLVGVFEEGTVEKKLQGVERLRKDAYRRDVKNYLDSADALIMNKVYEWLRKVNDSLINAESTSKNGKISGEQAAKIIAVRRKAYEEAVKVEVDAAKALMESKGYEWLVKLDRHIDEANRYANAKVIGSKANVFTQSKRRQLLSNIVKARKDGYRIYVKDQLVDATGKIDRAGYEWLDKMNGCLRTAQVAAENGDVLGELSLLITELRRKGYKKKVEGYINEAKTFIEQKRYEWKGKAKARLDSAKRLVDAVIPDSDKPVFNDEQKFDMSEEIAAVRMSME